MIVNRVVISARSLSPVFPQFVDFIAASVS